MDRKTIAFIVEEGGKVMGDLLRVAVWRPIRRVPKEEATSRPETQKVPSAIVALPTTQETIQQLKRRLGKELYRIEMDLQEGARIAGRACDCLGKKHMLGLEATAEELMSYEANPVYGQITAWFSTHEAEFEPEEIAKREPVYYQSLAPEVRAFRKRVLGTEMLGAVLTAEAEERKLAEALTLDEAMRLATEAAARRVEETWGKET